MSSTKIFKVTLASIAVLALLACTAEAARPSKAFSPPLNEECSHPLDAYHEVNLTCHWEERNGHCGLHRAHAGALFRHEGNDFSQMIADFIDCRESFSEESCSQHYCDWDVTNEVCVYTGFGIGRELSPCYSPAPGTNQLGNAGRLCSILTTAETCNNASRCTWGQGGCATDSLALFTNFTTTDYVTATAFKTQQLTAAAAATFNVSDEDFEWNDILQWDIPETPCPPTVHQEACEMADDALSMSFPTSAYCSLRYADPSLSASCLDDDRCVYNTDRNACQAIGDPLTFFTAAGPFVVESLDRFYLSVIGDCSIITNASLCNGQCIWDTSSDTCGINSTILYTGLIALDDEDSSDAICTYHRLTLNSGCLNQFHEENCLANINCYWNQYSQQCGRDIYYYVRNVPLQDESVIEDYNCHNDRCESNEDEESCEGNQD